MIENFELRGMIRLKPKQIRERNIRSAWPERTCMLVAWVIVQLVYLVPLSAQPLSPAKDFGYTEEHPLIIVSDWDFRPFEFINVEGQPAGYNVDVLNLILDQLNIPHKFVMQEWHVATSMFKKHEADLIHALYFFFKDSPYVSTHKYINYYSVNVARRTNTPPLNRLGSLQPTDTLLLKEADYAAMVLASKDRLPFATEYHSPKDALTGISQGRYKYFVWGETPLRHKIQELGLDSIALDEIDIPAGELRIIGYNQELTNLIDDQYTRLEQAGELQKIYDHWFRPEREHDDTSPVVLLILAGLLLTAVVVGLLIYFVRRRVRKAVRRSSDLGQMMDHVLNMGNYFVLEWDFKSNILRNRYGDMLPNGEMRPEEFLARMPPEEAKRLHGLDMQLAAGVITHFDMNLQFNRGTAEAPQWRNYFGSGIVEMEHGKTTYLYYTTKDITEELNEDRRIKTIASKYQKMFDTNLVAMSFYDANGVLIDLNQKMRELCQINSESEQYFYSSILFNFPNLKGVYLPGSREVIHVCQHLNEPQLGLDKYIEFRIQPVTNDDDELVYYIVTSRDITPERDLYLKQREHDRQLRATNEEIERYEQQLGYLLVENQMYIWNFLPAENKVYMKRSAGQEEYSETIEEYLLTVNADVRQQAKEEIEEAMRQGKPYITILPFDHTLFDDQPTWYSVSGIPIFNKEGQITEYFGMSRNITSFMEAQEKLRIETARAEDSGRQKAAFLANMTHEIRTPLNAIVGFSDLLPVVDTMEERMAFIRIIRNNCDMLLRLINDILEASDITTGTISVNPEEVDFAQVFNDICQTLEQRVQENPGVAFIKDNPYESFVTTIDKGRMQQVITNFVTNAVKYTKEGLIRVGYRAMDSDELSSITQHPTPATQTGIYMYCEDTGAGIPKEKQASVFERFVKLNDFVQGTGLGLSICQAIAERCNGQIGVMSEGDGKGSTFWVWIPCVYKK